MTGSAPAPDRRPPEIAAICRVLNEHRVRFVVTGSAAAVLHGVEAVPGDLDIVPATDPDNLDRLAGALDELDARLDPDAAFGDWHVREDGEREWATRDAHLGEAEARGFWRPDPAVPASFDHGLLTRLGNLDVVPEVAGLFDDLRARSRSVSVEGIEVQAASIDDLLVTLTVPRRAKDGPRVRALREIQLRRVTSPRSRARP